MSSLIAALQGIEDYRAPRGKRYPLWVMLLLVILGTLSECYGYAALEDFCVRHYAALSEKLGITYKRLPSDSTFRRLFEQLDFEKLTDCFVTWAKAGTHLGPGSWLAVDGKSIKSTVKAYNQSYQNFVNVVSVYSHQQGVVVALKQFQNHEQSEIKVLEKLLETLNFTGVVFTCDALHCQKKLCS
ncbi:transposase [Nostoc sp. NIES-3756]|uniref:ISAs1 family transposase n=1 Tax=Nostoc sp. NIES-3756 TaxID=1751286 RepID=UPI000721ABA7|nr:ISAs1 family transposase [Nostoc sp. NIES-3756]BAT51732.1 transposase [Nostoc sp. NIES-3756]BAT52334.1 transposase [Nostoc sp. NIES-3756]BAT52435.1 transposase [Nostoc sp. NIES-3756]BAT52459.1 transposase [Nostoc sp. NIES-3756]BAT52550.1 transposase [Nostoc sp. NIES-3756]